MKGTVFASFTPFRVRSCNVSLWLLQMISTHVHSKLSSINQCPVTSHKEAINRQQEKSAASISRQGELALIFKTLSQMIDEAVFLERRGNWQSPGARSSVL